MRTRKLLPGGAAARTALEEQRVGATGIQYKKTETAEIHNPRTDWRVRISLPPRSRFAFRGIGATDETVDQNVPIENLTAGLMNELRGTQGLGTDGVVFPYTPQITITHTARYSEQALTHSNYKNFFYEGSEIANIQIQGVFTCQNDDEAIYLMSSIQFLRACTKMYFGLDDKKAGTPPTLVRLSGYGGHYIPGSVNCVVTSVSHAMPDDVDYIQYKMGAYGGWMPIQSTLTVNLQPVVSRTRQATRMRLDDFVKGSYLGGATSTTPYDEEGGIF